MKKQRLKKQTKSNILIEEITLYGKMRSLLIESFRIMINRPVSLGQICQRIKSEKCQIPYEREILLPVEKKFMKDILNNLVCLSKKKERTKRKIINVFCDLKAMISILQKRLDQFFEKTDQNMHTQLLQQLKTLESQVLTIKREQRKKQAHKIEIQVPEQISQNRIVQNFTMIRSSNKTSKAHSRKQNSKDFKSLRSTCVISQGKAFSQSRKNSVLQENTQQLRLSSPYERRNSKIYLKSKRKKLQDDQQIKNHPQISIIKTHQKSKDMLQIKKDQQDFQIDIEKIHITNRKKIKRRNRASNFDTNMANLPTESCQMNHFLTERKVKNSSLKKYSSKEQSKKFRNPIQSILSNQQYSKSRFYQKKHNFKDVKKVHRKKHKKLIQSIKQMPQSQGSLLFLGSKSRKSKNKRSKKVSILKLANDKDKIIRKVSNFESHSKSFGQTSEQNKSFRPKILSHKGDSLNSLQVLKSSSAQNISNQNDRGIVRKQTIKKMEQFFKKIGQLQASNNSDFFIQQQKLRVRENQIFQNHLQRMQLKSALSFKDPFPIQKSYQIKREQKLMTLDRALVFENDNEWLKAFKQNPNEIEQIQVIWASGEEI